MHDCTAPEDLITVLGTVWPGLPFATVVLFAIAAVLGLLEASLKYNFGGVPDGLIGMGGLAALGVGVIVWGSSWPSGCTGHVAFIGWLVIGIAVLVAALLYGFWRARRHDGGTLLRGYGDGGGTDSAV